MSEHITYLMIKYNNGNDIEILKELPNELLYMVYDKYRSEVLKTEGYTLNIISSLRYMDISKLMSRIETTFKIDDLMKEVLIEEVKKYYV